MPLILPYMPLTWTTGQSRSPIVDLGEMDRGLLLIPASWDGSATIKVYCYTQSTPSSPADPFPKSGSGFKLYYANGTEMSIDVAASEAVVIPPEVFYSRFVAFDSSSAPTAGLAWFIDGKARR